MHRTAREGYRVLIAAPYGRDAEGVAALLAREGYDARICDGVPGIVAALDDDTGAVLLTEEALVGQAGILRTALEAQPEWSDVPFILLAAQQARNVRASEAARLRFPDIAGNMIVLDRPLGSLSLVSAIASAMRSRQKQFEMRDRLADLAERTRELDESRSALLASEGELRTIADALPVLIGFIDRALVYRFANRAYEDWFYLSPSEVIGRRVIDIVGVQGFANRKDALAAALAGERVEIELAWPHRDGRRRVADIRYLPRRDEHGQVDGFHVFVLDVTHRKVAEETLREAADTLETKVAERTAALAAEATNRAQVEAALRQSQKMEAVGQLTGGIAHDFNNMLTGVIGSIDIVKRRIAAGRFGELDRFMDAASTSANRAAALTQRLLAFSRRQSLDARPLDINALVGSLEELLARTLTERITLEIDADAGGAAGVADANQLESAILNLAINARDAMPDGGRLTIATRRETIADAQSELAAGDYVAIAVADTGTGMSAELMEKVFEPFFTTKPIGQGTGLGLSMVYGFVRQSGGQVRIESVEGEGTRVTMMFPAAEIEPVDAPAPIGTVPDGAGQRVLVVEDDPSVRLLVGDVLAELGYEAIEAAAPDAALPILASDRPIELMISDVGLPGMNGRQLAEIARRHRPELPILFITGYAETAAIRSEFLGDNMTMIAKPFAFEALAAKVSEMVAPIAA